MEPDHHARLRELCRGITLRLLPDDAISGSRDTHLGIPVRASIARDPDEFDELLPLAAAVRERLCPVCRTMTEPSGDALRASLELEFAKSGISAVWSGLTPSALLDAWNRRAERHCVVRRSHSLTSSISSISAVSTISSV
jgi:hypothetical protein